MEAALTGSVRIQPLSEKEAPMVLALQGDEVSLPDSAPAALKQDGRVAVDITLAPGAFVSSLVGRSAMLRLAIEDTILLRQAVFLSASGKDGNWRFRRPYAGVAHERLWRLTDRLYGTLLSAANGLDGQSASHGDVEGRAGECVIACDAF